MLALTLVGCFLIVDEDTFPDQYASLQYSRVMECQRGYFEAEYDADMEDCTDDYIDYFDDIEKADCDFDDDEARDCLEKVQASTCGDLTEDYPKDCFEVYTCGGIADWF